MVQEEIGDYQNPVEDEKHRMTGGVDVSINLIWLLFGGVIIFIMQAGFGMLEAGSVRYKNHMNSLLKNALIPCVGGIVWFLFGFAFGFGNVMKNFIGRRYFALSYPNHPTTQSEWFFQYVIACCSASIGSGSVAERVNIVTFLFFAALMIGFIFPVPVAWTWGQGWLTQIGYTDFSGSGMVHLVGGVAGFMGAFFIGPRIGKNEDPQEVRTDPQGYEKIKEKYRTGKMTGQQVEQWARRYTMQVDDRNGFAPYSHSLYVLGTLILWMGWLCFNSCSGIFLNTPEQQEWARRSMVNSIISPSIGGLHAFILRNYILNRGEGKYKRYDMSTVTNGILIGAVSVTGCCHQIEPWAACAIGFISIYFYMAGHIIMDKIGLDDALEAVQVHAFGGMWGIIAVAFFSKDVGILYSHPDSGRLLGIQLVGLTCMVSWSGIMSGIFFFVTNKLGVLRLSATEEIIGSDLTYFGPLQMEIDEISSNKGDTEMVETKRLFTNTKVQ